MQLIFSARRYWIPVALFGLAVFMIVQPTYVGWIYKHDASLGSPLWASQWWSIYGPDAALRWLGDWHGDQAFMKVWWGGVRWASWAAFGATVLGAWAAHVNSPLPPVKAEEQPDRFGEPEDLLASPRFSATHPGVVIGRVGKRVIWHTGDDHCLIVGTSRLAEKTTSFVLPTVADADCALVVLDVKGEIWKATADERRKRGPIWIVNPTSPGTHSYNPMLEIRRDDHCITDCRSLAHLVTADATGNDPFWATKAADLLAGIFRAVVLEAADRRRFPTLHRSREILLDIGAKKPPVVADRFAREMIESHMALEQRPRSGVDAQAQMALSFASDPAIAHATTKRDFTAADLVAGDQPGTAYLTMEVSSFEALHMYSRVVIQSLLLGLLHDQKMTIDGRRKKHRIMFIVDEFPSLGSLPFFEHAMATMAGAGIKAMLVCQSLAQIQRAYGHDQAIVANAGTQVLVPPFDDMTMRHATSRCGTMIAQLRARHRKIGWLDRQAETSSQSRHPRLSGSDAQRRSDESLVLPPAGLEPCWIRRNRWYENPRYRDRIRVYAPP